MSSQQPLNVGNSVPWGYLVWTLPLAYVFWEWWLFHLDGYEGVFLPLFAAAQIWVSGIGALFAVRHERHLQRREKATERERIAQDLHDVLGHSLSSLALKAELARRVFHTDPERTLTQIGEVERIARQTLAEVRAAIHGYHSGDILSELDRAESLLKAADVDLERRCEDLEMSPGTERVLALIEPKRSAARPSGARRPARACP